MSVDFAAIETDFLAIEGMTGLTSARLFHLFLEGQPNGPILEVGPYKGRSTIVLAHHLRSGEWLDLIDVHPYLDKPAFARFGANVRLFLGDSENLEKLLPEYQSRKTAYRFIHTDASHTFANVVNDLRHADVLLHPHGIVAVDDYENPNYPQVPVAVGAAIYKHGAALAPFLVCDNKLYLCRPQRRAEMLSFVVERAAPDLLPKGYILACTDLGEESPIALRPAMSTEQGQTVYGPDLFGHFIDHLRRPG